MASLEGLPAINSGPRYQNTPFIEDVGAAEPAPIDFRESLAPLYNAAAGRSSIGPLTAGGSPDAKMPFITPDQF